MGPVIDRANVERIDRIVEDARRYARIIVRGGPIVDGPLAVGAFYRPAMLETEALDVPLVQEEIFGPVLSFETFATEDEAITRANATVFGLAAALFTKDFDPRTGSPAPSRPARCGPTLGELSATRSKRAATSTAASDARGVFAPWRSFRK
jgi:acyl-CoA reductase-like NAD-dependent aldehyde dehydrogenase